MNELVKFCEHKVFDYDQREKRLTCAECGITMSEGEFACFSRITRVEKMLLSITRDIK